MKVFSLCLVVSLRRSALYAAPNVEAGKTQNPGCGKVTSNAQRWETALRAIIVIALVGGSLLNRINAAQARPQSTGRGLVNETWLSCNGHPNIEIFPNLYSQLIHDIYMFDGHNLYSKSQVDGLPSAQFTTRIRGSSILGIQSNGRVLSIDRTTLQWSTTENGQVQTSGTCEKITSPQRQF